MYLRIHDALLRIENLERLLTAKEGTENVEYPSKNRKESLVLLNKREESQEHEHERLRRNARVDISSLVKRLQNVEQRLVYV